MNVKYIFIFIFLTFVFAYPTGKCRCYNIYADMDDTKQGARDKNIIAISHLRAYYRFREDANNSFLADCVWYESLSQNNKRELNQSSTSLKNLIKNCPSSPLDKIKDKNTLDDFLRYISCSIQSMLTFGNIYRCTKD